MQQQIYKLTIKNNSFYITGSSDINQLKEIAGIIGIKYDQLELSKLSFDQNIIKVWAIGELADYLNSK